jgi:very-short-patch-repair endonuclease
MPHAAVAPEQRGRAKSLRQRMTRAETLLWRYIKADRVEGLSFRRQVPMQQYVADFICHAAHLVVELDGESHDFVSRQRSDTARDRWFESQGYKVLRFTNEEVLTNLEGVVETIRAEARRVAPPSLSLPHKGGGNAQTDAEPRATPLRAPPPQGGREQAAARGKSKQ